MIRFLLILMILNCLPRGWADPRTRLFEILYQDLHEGSYECMTSVDKDSLVGMELFKKLHQCTGEGYESHFYNDAKEFLYDVVNHSDGKVHTLYSDQYASSKGTKYYEDGDSNEDGTYGDFVNCEHLWPQSKFSKLEPMVSDLHHLYPTFSIPNQIRGSAPFGKVNRPTYRTSAGSQFGAGEFEPHDAIKGNVARGMLYFVMRYQDQPILRKTDVKRFWNQRISQFQEWHELDPPDAEERIRNDRIESFQGNRNPFIDRPELVARIGTEPFLLK